MPKLIIAVLAMVVCVTAAWAADALVFFEIKDQFDQVHRTPEYAGKPLVLLGCDRKGSEFIGGWEDAVRARVDLDQVRMQSVATVKGVPFFIKGKVKKAFGQDPATDAPVLLDWKGLLHETYAWEKDGVNMLVFNRHGRLVARAYGTEVDTVQVQALLDAIDPTPHPR